MKTFNESNRTNPESAPAALDLVNVSDRAPRYRPRENGVGYGNSSGYASARSFVGSRSYQALRSR